MRISSNTLARIAAHPAPPPRRAIEPIEGELLLASESAHEHPHPERDRPEPIPLTVVVIRASRPEDISHDTRPRGVDLYEQVLRLGAAKTLGFSAIA